MRPRTKRISTMRTTRGATGLHVHCMDCAWDEEETSSDEAMRALSGRARYHAGSQGHKVHIWRETLFVYVSTYDRRTTRSGQRAPNGGER